MLRRLADSCNMRMFLQELAEGSAEDSHPAAMDDAHARQPGQKSPVNKFFDFGGRVIDGLADDVDLARRAGIIFFEGHRDPTLTGRLYR